MTPRGNALLPGTYHSAIVGLAGSDISKGNFGGPFVAGSSSNSLSLDSGSTGDPEKGLLLDSNALSSAQNGVEVI